MQVFNRPISGRSLTVFGFETALIAGAVLVAVRASGPPEAAMESALWRAMLITAVCTLSLYYNDVYDLTAVRSLRELAARGLQAAGVVSIVLGFTALWLPDLVISSEAYLLALGMLLVTIPLWRVAFEGVSSDAHLEQTVLILGTGASARAVAQQIAAQHEFPYRVAGFVEDRPGVAPAAAALGHVDNLRAIIAAEQINLVIVGASERRGTLPVQELLRAKLSGVRVEDAATTYERVTGKILLEDLKPSWMIFSDGFRAARATRSIKRLVDLVLASIGLLLAWPLMLLTALAVRLESRGDALYRQERVGERGRIFTLMKFRSMRQDAEDGTPIWACAGDERVTRVGRVIRLTRLDELPQLWNVLRGDMSFVGPRPERPFFVEQLTAVIPYYGERHAVKPGVTGWAQVKYRYGASIDDATEKLRYDLYYIKHLSILFDLTIVLDTVKVILCRKGAQ